MTQEEKPRSCVPRYWDGQYDQSELFKEHPVADCHELEKEVKRMVYDAVYDLDGPAIIGTSKYLSVEDVANIARHFYELGQQSRPKESEDLDFQTFAKEMEELWLLPSEETKNDEDNPLRWEHAIARHFAEWGSRTREEIGR